METTSTLARRRKWLKKSPTGSKRNSRNDEREFLRGSPTRNLQVTKRTETVVVEASHGLAHPFAESRGLPSFGQTSQHWRKRTHVTGSKLVRVHAGLADLPAKTRGEPCPSGKDALKA